MGVAAACVFIAGVCVLAATGALPAIVPAVYVVASLIAVALYRGDKSAAMTGRRRTPEQTLLVLGLFGGWPGAAVAQRLFRHKSRKASFQALFWTSAVLNAAALVWLWRAFNR